MIVRLLFTKLIASYRYLILIFICFLGSYTLTFAQHSTLEGILQQIIEKPISENNARIQSSASQAYLVQVKPGTTSGNLQREGIHILRKLNQTLFIIQAAQRPKPDSVFARTWPVNHLWKLSDELLLKGNPNQPTTYTIKVTGPSARKTIAALPQVKITSVTNDVLTIFTSLETIKKNILPINEVTYVGVESATPRVESPVLDMNLHPNGVNRIHHTFPTLTGQGITISIQEQLYQTDDIDLKGRHIPSAISATEVSRHATEMATIAAGAGNSFITGKGVASGARITSSAFDDLLPDADESYAALNAWVQNHSYGTTIENFYGIRAEAFDASANRNPALLHVFSSGNEGFAVSSNGPYQGVKGFANLTGNFKMSKNTLSVGAVDTVGRPMPFSSRGPAHDGRIKPEVVAYSTAGSSNAAALVTGTVALLQQAYVQQTGKFPASALLKALLINSAMDAGQAGIDHVTGYGHVDAYRTLLTLKSKHFFTGKVNQGEKKKFTLQIPANACQLKITLVWNDLAASPNANVALVNDLDLQVTDHKGKQWLPWILDTTADSASLHKPAIRAADHLNNVEQISVDSLAAGTYTLSVNGYDVSNGPQEFSIAYQWDTRQTFEWTSPTGSDNMPYNGETDSYFTWKSTLADTIGRLEYTTDAGKTWQIIAEDVNLTKGNYRWQVPQVVSLAQARMVVGTTTYPSDNFTISFPLPLTVAYNCADSLLIQWPAVKENTHYALSIVDENAVNQFFVLPDTQVVLNKHIYPAGLFSVQPIIGEGIKGIQTQGLALANLASSCFLLSFHVETANEGVKLITQLGTTFGVQRIIFEREKNGLFEQIGSMEAQSTQVNLIDNHPDQGLNTYRSRIFLANGHEIISDTEKTYFLTEPPFIVFPNPAQTMGKLQVFSKEFTEQSISFRLYRADGIRVLATELLTNRETFSLPALEPGLYVYTIGVDQRQFTGKLLIN
ncbi:S8 family serine peptidase [Rhodocytophaga aerolata]|uniref:S8 family serine peptidase n=1 Tax=Rhodocytophaga aerolata TaxID=455078 RepID=A0ABT8R3Q3_9BACT|nr:S8 family serine peptidase [Rhodocytophaga aerolata]MDO1446735.1 S8 family serine peptidase [Rhodocytophaga aerolata]